MNKLAGTLLGVVGIILCITGIGLIPGFFLLVLGLLLLNGK
jgi:hypothetical protein